MMIAACFAEAFQRYLPTTEDTMQGISIKGQKLHEIGMPVAPQETGACSRVHEALGQPNARDGRMKDATGHMGT
jgi:hypothetical protein